MQYPDHNRNYTPLQDVNAHFDRVITLPGDEYRSHASAQQVETSRLEQMRNAVSDAVYGVAERYRSASRRTRAIAAGALVVGLLATGVGGIEAKQYLDHRGEDSALIADTPEGIHEYTHGFLDYKVHDKNKDPSFRASSVAVMQGGNLIGSGSIVKVEDQYKFVTVEHVARTMFDLPALVESANNSVAITTEDNQKEAHSPNSIHVPGVGVLKISDNKSSLEFSGKEAPADSNDPTDRLSIVTLPDAAERILSQAESDGTIKVSELAKFSAEIGDEFWMPLADTGKKIPFMYIGSGRQNGDPQFVPLVVMNEELNYDTARAELLSGMQKYNEDFVAKAKANGSIAHPDDGVAAWTVIREKAVAFGERHKDDDFEHDDGVTNWLPCMGDSGSPMLNSKGEVIGTLSSGSPFSGGPNGVYLERHNLGNFECLADATVSLPHE